jgi:hypothetical protein
VSVDRKFLLSEASVRKEPLKILLCGHAIAGHENFFEHGWRSSSAMCGATVNTGTSIAEELSGFITGSAEKMQQWEFGMGLDHRWYWRRLAPDGTYLECDRTFDSRLQCIADAFEHGYLSPQTSQSVFLHEHLPPKLRGAPA